MTAQITLGWMFGQTRSHMYVYTIKSIIFMMVKLCYPYFVQ